MDFVPGQVSYIWAEPTKVGSYDLLCEELCGVGHYAMRGRVVVDDSDNYAAWRADQPTFADTQAALSADLVAGQASYAVCGSCHGANGEGNAALHAPQLAGMDPEYMKRQLRHFKRGVRGTHEEDTWGRTMAPMAMTLADASAIDVVAYINTLPGADVAETIAGDPSKSAALYQSTCAQCHGDDGQGMDCQRAGTDRTGRLVHGGAATEIPGWHPGRHDDDLYGLQMGLLSNTLVDDEAVNDMVAYINTL